MSAVLADTAPPADIPAVRTAPDLGRPGGSGLRTADRLQVGCIALLALVGGCEWYRVFGWGPVLWRVTAAAILPAAVAVVFRLRRPHGAGPGVIVSLVILAWFLAVACLHDSVGLVIPTLAAPGGIVSGLVNGWAGILSLPLPVPAQGGYLVLPVTLTWLAALVGAEVVLRTRWRLAAAVPAGVAYALSLLFGIGGGGSRVAGAALFLAVLLVLAGTTARPIVAEGRSEGGAVRRRVLEMGGCLAGVVVVAALLGPVLPLVGSGKPYDPRASRIPPVTLSSAINPLDQLSVWAQDPNGPTLLTVHWSGPPQSLRVAVLNHYDTLNGWTASARFAPAGSQLPVSAQSAGATAESQDITLGAMPGPWLPAAVRPVRLTGVRALVDPSTGVLVAAAGTRGLRYQVTSEVPAPANCALDAAVPFSPGTSPAVPSAIASLANQYAGGATTPCARAVQLADAFPKHFSYSPAAPSGSDLRTLLNFVSGSKATGGGTGTYEQAAAVYALMAESLGMEARVVVGFHAGRPLGGNAYQIHPNDAYAWVEVNFVGAGWVPFYPTLANSPTPPADKTDQASSKFQQNPNVTTPSSHGPKEQATPAQLHQGQGSGWAVAGVVIGIVLLALLVLLLGAAVVVRAVRRRRRRSRREVADPRRRVLGAWEESLDDLSTVGVRPRPSETAQEVVTAGAARLGDQARAPLGPLGALSNAALFSDRPPAAADADAAWTHADSVAALAAGALGRWGRIRRAVDLRILVRHRGR